MKQKKNLRIFEYSVFFILGFLVAGFLFSSNFSSQEQNIKEIEEEEIGLIKASANIVAVSSLDNSGIFGKVNVELTEGYGKILVNTNPFLEPDIQYSVNIAAEVAQRIAIQKIGERNLIYTFEIEQANVLGGHSAGAAMTIATLSALLGKEIREDVVITGTIREDGVIGPIGGLIEKAQAAAENNKKIFLIPKGQSKLTYYEKETRKSERNGLTIYRTYYIPKTFDLEEYADQELNLEIIEVETIYDVMNIMFKE